MNENHHVQVVDIGKLEQDDFGMKVHGGIERERRESKGEKVGEGRRRGVLDRRKVGDRR